jgi:hypothetical protein
MFVSNAHEFMANGGFKQFDAVDRLTFMKRWADTMRTSGCTVTVDTLPYAVLTSGLS